MPQGLRVHQPPITRDPVIWPSRDGGKRGKVNSKPLVQLDPSVQQLVYQHTTYTRLRPEGSADLDAKRYQTGAGHLFFVLNGMVLMYQADERKIPVGPIRIRECEELKARDVISHTTLDGYYFLKDAFRSRRTCSTESK